MVIIIVIVIVMQCNAMISMIIILIGRCWICAPCVSSTNRLWNTSSSGFARLTLWIECNDDMIWYDDCNGSEYHMIRYDDCNDHMIWWLSQFLWWGYVDCWRYTLEYGLGAQDGVKRPFLQVSPKSPKRSYKLAASIFVFFPTVVSQTTLFFQGRMNTNIKYNITSKR